MLRIVVHDLKSTSNSYIGIGQTLSYLVKTGQFGLMREVADRLELTSRQMNILLGDLAFWTASGNNKIKVQKTNSSISESMIKILSVYRNVANQKGVLITADIKELYLWTDKNLLEIILRNILDNSVKHASAGGKVYVTLDSEKLRVRNTSERVDVRKINQIQEHFEGKRKLSFGQNDTGLGVLLIQEFASELGLTASISWEVDSVSMELYWNESVIRHRKTLSGGKASFSNQAA